MPEPTDTPRMAAVVQVEQTHLRLPSRPDWIEPAVEYLKQKALLCGACQEKRANKLLIALHEAVCNAIVHGNLEVSSALKEQGDGAFARALAERAADPLYATRTVEVFVDYDGQRCQWAITDQGPGFDVEATLRRVTNPDPELLMLSSGRGILMMRSFMDDVRFEADGRRVILTLNKSSGQEKRQQERVPFNTPLRVAPVRADGSVDWDAAYEAVSRDLSREGISLLQSRLADSEKIIIAMYAGGAPIYLPAEVKHCRTLDGDTVEIGCRFRAVSEPAAAGREPPGDVGLAIDRLLEQAHGRQTQSQERRSHPRVAYTERIEVLAGPGRPAIPGHARDLSRGGVAFLTTGPLPRHVTVVFPAKSSGDRLRVRAEVVRCVRVHNDVYDVAARFLELEGAG